MKALRLHGYDTRAEARIEEIPVPEPGPDEILVRVTAASVNPLDLQLQAGLRKEVFPLEFPYIAGTDFAGIVERTGPLAGHFRQGVAVIARSLPTAGGAFAQYAVVAARHAALAPSLPAEQAAALPTAAGTAWEALFEVAKLRRGQSLLVHAGAGSVGSFAIQLGKLVGARVAATASGGGLALVRDLGADLVIDYSAGDFAARATGFDLVLDTVGGETQARSYKVLKAGGTLVSITTPVDPAKAAAHDVRAMRMGHITDGARLGLIAALCQAGKLRPLIDSTHDFDAAPAAFERVASRRARGKVVVRIN